MTTRTIRTSPGVERARAWAPRRNVLDPVGGLLPILVALALWAWLLAGVLAPLGDALSRIERGGAAPAPVKCPMPPDGLASAPATGAE